VQWMQTQNPPNLFISAVTPGELHLGAALAYDFVLVTRNVRHFRCDGLELINPWEP
jgi:predicted nucleic acid-binding protein